MVQKLLRLPDVIELSGLSRSCLYKRIAEGLWPKPVPLGGRLVAWPENEVGAMNQARISGIKDAQIRKLVSNIEYDRKPPL